MWLYLKWLYILLSQTSHVTIYDPMILSQTFQVNIYITPHQTCHATESQVTIHNSISNMSREYISSACIYFYVKHLTWLYMILSQTFQANIYITQCQASHATESQVTIYNSISNISRDYISSDCIQFYLKHPTWLYLMWLQSAEDS